jgi:DNA polymerase-3 subunit alpha
MADMSTLSTSDFVPLHCHSYFSILDGLNAPEDMAARAVENGHSAMAITDHGVCSGLYRFNDACKNAKRCRKCSFCFSSKDAACPKCKSKDVEKKPIKPIFGMEAYVVDDVSIRRVDENRRHVTLWAKDADGYRNLIWLSTFGCTAGAFVKPRISLKLLAERRKGLAAGTACVKGFVASEAKDGGPDKAMAALGMLKDMFGDDLYVEFMNHRYLPAAAEHEASALAAMRVALEVADRAGVKPIFTYDSHYCRPDDADPHRVLLAIQTKNTIKNPKCFSFRSGDFYMRTLPEVVERCLGREDLVRNTSEVAEKIGSGLMPKFPFQDLLPLYVLPSGYKTEEQLLKKLVKEGMIRRGVYDRQEYRDRVLYELEVIVKLGFVRYFLVLWDAVNYAKKHGIRIGVGRGSAAGSLCVYCLDVTQLDPLKYGLLFERFINPDRVSPPDVDVDFDDSRQDDMFRYASSKYGEQFVARIGTYGTLGAKDALKTVGKALDIGGDWTPESVGKPWKTGTKTNALVNAITKSIDEKAGTPLASIMKTNQEVQGYAAQHPDLFSLALKVEGTVKNPGEHAAGIVLCNRPLSDIIPLRHDKDGQFCSQFDKDEVEPLGLLKYDFLGLRNLRTIEMCLRLIRERHGKDIDVDALVPDDKGVFRMLNDGHVHGVFQFEGRDGRVFDRRGSPTYRTMGGLLVNIGVDSFNDMIACVALFRPGTLQGTWDGKSVPETYCDYKHGRKPVKYLHPKMETLLGETYGMMVYQEQVMIVARAIAGFTMVEADTFRRGIGKKDDAIVQGLRDQFVAGCVRNGVLASDAAKIFELSQSFSGYGFNKSHAACYAYIGYQCAWLKFHYKLEFAAALLTTSIGGDKLLRYEEVFGRAGVGMLSHHVNKSKDEYVIEGNALRRPLTSLKGIGSPAAQAIMATQPFRDLRDFATRINGRAVTKTAFETLINAGAMDCLGMSRSAMLASYGEAKEIARGAAKERAAEKKRLEDYGALDLFGMGDAGLGPGK